MLDNSVKENVTNLSIGGRITKEAKGNNQVSICWNNMKRELTPATSS